MNNQAIIEQFYTAFQQKDYKTMQSLYHPDATFTDEAFVGLNSQEVQAMWQMLVSRSKDLQITFSNIQVAAHQGSCEWQAHYTFGKTGNKVHNIIQAQFEFKDGKIIKHRDTFDFHRWAGQALGIMGKLLGWTSFLKNKVSQTARQQLDSFIANRQAK
jgi:ketosteroid isomerase-like protein